MSYADSIRGDDKAFGIEDYSSAASFSRAAPKRMTQSS